MWMCDAGAINLAVGVVQQAVIDYRFAQRMSKAAPEVRKGFTYGNSTASDTAAAVAPERQLEQIERFFRGRWFHTLVDLDGAEIVRLLKETPQGKRIVKNHGKSDGRTRVRDVPRGRPGRPIDWELVTQWPDIKARLEAGGWSRGDVSRAMGLCDASVLIKLMRSGTEKTRRRMLEAVEKLEGK